MINIFIWTVYHEHLMYPYTVILMMIFRKDFLYEYESYLKDNVKPCGIFKIVMQYVYCYHWKLEGLLSLVIK